MRLPPISTKASRIAGAGLAAIAVFLALSWALRLKDAPPAGKSGRVDAKQPAAEAGLDKRHEAMALESELKKKPNHVPILFRLAQLARENGKNSEAVTHFRKIIELEFPQLSVLSYQELSENLRIQPIARVGLQRG